MNVLLITEAFPPAPVVGSFRAYKVARALKSQGHTVHVLTMRGGAAEDVRAGESEEGITWERIKPWPGPKQLYGLLARPFKGRASATTPASAPQLSQSDESSARRSGFRQLLSSLIIIPDDRQGLVPAVIRAAWSRRGWADIIYATAPSFSVLLAGGAAHRALGGVPWVAELRDPWIGNAGRSGNDAPRAVARLDRWLETSCLRTASAIVLVSPKAAGEYEERYGPQGIPVICALNGIDDLSDDDVLRRPGDEIRIVYAGSVYPPRDPEPLVRALCTALSEFQRKVRLTFVGSGGWTEAPGLAQAVDDLPPCVTVERLAWLPQHEARSIISGADLVLLPAQRWVLQIPNKLYDYLGSRVPILALVEPDSDTERMLLSTGGHFVARVGDAQEELARVATAALEAAASGLRMEASALLKEWTTDMQMTLLVKAVEEVAPSRTGSAASMEIA